MDLLTGHYVYLHWFSVLLCDKASKYTCAPHRNPVLQGSYLLVAMADAISSITARYVHVLSDLEKQNISL